MKHTCNCTCKCINNNKHSRIFRNKLTNKTIQSNEHQRQQGIEGERIWNRMRLTRSQFGSQFRGFMMYR